MTQPPTPAAWSPTPEDVALILRARTKDDHGVELGLWSDATRPTYEEVVLVIEVASTFVVASVGAVADRCSGAARNAALLHAACLVELSYFPEQIRSDRSPYEELRALADTAVADLRACAGTGDDGGGGGEGFGYHSLPIVPATTEAAYDVDGWRSPEYPATWQRPCFAPDPVTPAVVLEPEPPPEPPINVVVGHPAEGDPIRGLPPIITDPDDA
jgi:hypothetical protein